MADGPKAEDFKPDGPVRQPFMFDMLKGEDAGQGFPMLQLPPKEEPRAPKHKAKPSTPVRHRLLGLKLKAPVRNFLLAVLAGQAFVVGAILGLPRIVAIPPWVDLPALVLAAATAVATLACIMAMVRRSARAFAGSFFAAVIVCATCILLMQPKSSGAVPERVLRAVQGVLTRR